MELLVLAAWDSLPEQATGASAFPESKLMVPVTSTTSPVTARYSLIGTLGVHLRQLLYCRPSSFSLIPIGDLLRPRTKDSSLLHSQGCLNTEHGVRVGDGHHGVRNGGAV